MSALDFLKSDDTSDVVFTEAPASIEGDVVVRGREVRFEGAEYAGVESVKGFSKVSALHSSTRRSTRHLLKSSAMSSSHEPVEVSDGAQASDERSVDEKGKGLAVKKKKKIAGKKAVPPVVQGLGVDDVYVPRWKVRVGDSFKDPEVCGDALAHFAPPPIRDVVSKMEGFVLMNRLVLSFANLAPLLAEGVSRFKGGVEEYERFSAAKDEMSALMKASLEEKEKNHAEQVQALVKKHEAELVELKNEVEGLKASLSRANDDNKWLIEHGFQQVVSYLLHSSEFNSVLGGVYNRLLSCGKHLGLVAGYEFHGTGEPVEKSPLFNEAAHDQFVHAVNAMEKLTYPYVCAVSACYGKPLSVLQGLKPEGLKEKAAQDVIDSLSKKRLHTSDSDETFSGADGSQVGSLEASVAADVTSPVGGSKRKKKKVTQASTSKPLVDV